MFTPSTLLPMSLAPASSAPAHQAPAQRVAAQPSASLMTNESVAPGCKPYRRPESFQGARYTSFTPARRVRGRYA